MGTDLGKFWQSAIQRVVRRVKVEDVKFVVCEPAMKKDEI